MQGAGLRFRVRSLFCADQAFLWIVICAIAEWQARPYSWMNMSLARIMRGGGGDRSLDQLDAELKRNRNNIPPELDTNWKLLWTLMLGSLGTLVVTYSTLVWIYTEKVAETPCVGICEITPKLVRASPPGCRPENPFQLFYPHIPKTAGTTMEALINSRKHIKEFEMVKLREWRDAVPDGVVYLAPQQKQETSSSAYEAMFRRWIHRNVMQTERKHRSVFFGHVFFHDFSQPLNPLIDDLEKYELRHEHVGITVLREPIARLVSQYAFDRTNAKGPQYQQQVLRVQGDLPFADCAADSKCVRKNAFSRWCSLQTRYVCGWGSDCQPAPDGGATERMLAKAKDHLEHLFSVVGVQERWIDSLRLFEKVLPTFFEGIVDEYKAGSPENCDAPNFFSTNSPGFWYQKYVEKKKCPYHNNATPLQNGEKKEKKMHSVPKEGSIAHENLKKACWADLELYKLANELMDKQAAACRL